MRSVAKAELLVAGQKLTKEITQERSALPRTSYEEWMERRAEAGDGRAAAQIRGWLYQDRRNLRRIDKRNGNAAGQLQPQNQPVAGRGSAVDWQELAHERLRQMKQQAAFRDAVKGMAWKVDGATGDVVYRVGGVDALIDQGKKIVVLAPDKDATRVALQIAIHKYGSTIDASGTAEWQAELIKAAVQDDVQVTFTDPKLQQRLIAAREAALHQAVSLQDRPRPGQRAIPALRRRTRGEIRPRIGSHKSRSPHRGAHGKDWTPTRRHRRCRS